MTRHDLLVRGARLAWLPGAPVGDVASRTAWSPEIGTRGRRRRRRGDRRQRACTLLPGGVDPHVHLNEPGRTEWEGIATGTAALAVGGVTCAIDMPLNASPPVLDGRELRPEGRGRSPASRASTSRCGAGSCPATSTGSTSSPARGVVGFKAFMSYGGLDDFPPVDDLTLYEGMLRAAALGLPVAVHAESDAITAGLAARARAAGRTGVRDYLASRPVVAETEAIARAIHLAADTGCALHVVHVSTGAGVALVADARARGVDVTCEVCPHHLVLDEERHGAPRRDGEVRAAAAPAGGVRRAVDRGREPGTSRWSPPTTPRRRRR